MSENDISYESVMWFGSVTFVFTMTYTHILYKYTETAFPRDPDRGM